MFPQLIKKRNLKSFKIQLKKTQIALNITSMNSKERGIDYVSLREKLKDLKKPENSVKKATKMNREQVEKLLLRYKQGDLTIDQVLAWNKELNNISISKNTFLKIRKSFEVVMSENILETPKRSSNSED